MGPASIFLSHNKEDKDFVRRLADDLGRAGVKTWVDEAQIGIADSIIEKIEEGLQGSEYLGIVLSPSSVSSNWVKRELRTVMHQQISGKGKIVVPLLYKDCDIPLLLEDQHYADFRDPDNYEFMLRKLLNRLDPSFMVPIFVSRYDLEVLLDKLPIPAQRGSILSKYEEDDIDYVTANAISLSELEATVTWSKQKIYSALRELIADHKVEVFLFWDVISNDDHPSIAAGTKFVVPMIFRGLLPPHLRSPSEEIESLLRQLEAS